MFDAIFGKERMRKILMTYLPAIVFCTNTGGADTPG